LDMVRNIGGDGMGTRFFGVWDATRTKTLGVWILPNELSWLGRKERKKSKSTVYSYQQRWSLPYASWNGVDDVSIDDEEEKEPHQICKTCAEQMVRMKHDKWRRATKVGDKWKLPFWGESEE